MRINSEEKARYHNDVDMFWQKNSWVMAMLYKICTSEERKTRWWLGHIFTDNLSFHLLPKVKNIYGEGHVLLIFFPLSMTEMVQPIDAGYGHSLSSAIGRELDAWIMNEKKILKWEGKMTAMERRILVSHLVTRANAYMVELEYDNQRISCFERTWCLIITHANDKDSNIKPQGVTVPFMIPTVSPHAMIQENDSEPRDDDVDIRDLTTMFSEIDDEWIYVS